MGTHYFQIKLIHAMLFKVILFLYTIIAFNIMFSYSLPHVSTVEITKLLQAMNNANIQGYGKVIA